MGKKKLGIGIIGCGDISVHNVGAIAASRNAVVTYAMDVREDVARDIGERCGCPWTTRFEEVAASGDVDAVFLCTPHKLHAPLAIAAAKAGKHVISEKPIAATVADARRMVAACRQAGVTLSVAYVMRMTPGALKARELVAKGAIGKVIGADARSLSRKPDDYWTGGYSGRSRTDWRRSKAMSGGGILLMNLSHSFDALHFITGLKAVRISAEMDTFATDTEVEDYIAVAVRYDNGAVGSALACSCASGGGHPDTTRMRIVGADGQIVFAGGGLEVFTTKKVAGLKRGEWKLLKSAGRREVRRDFVERTAAAILAGRPVPIPGEEAIPALELCLGAYRAAETGRAWRAGG